LAAHWRYKEGSNTDSSLANKIVLLRQMLEWKREAIVKDLAGEERVYVFTPKGKVIDLAKGATVLDFAYHVHTEIGHHCRGAKVDSRMVPINKAITTGEKINIVTGRQVRPTIEWLRYARTRRARSKIKAWLRNESLSDDVARGRSCFLDDVQGSLHKKVKIEDAAKRLGFNDAEAFLAALGRKDLRPAIVIRVLTENGKVSKAATNGKPNDFGSEVQIYVMGVEVVGTLAKCCNPTMGDAVAGIVTARKGIVLHKAQCKNLLQYKASQEGRVLPAAWKGME
jgi:GTP pyrophosphokinase